MKWQCHFESTTQPVTYLVKIKLCDGGGVERVLRDGDHDSWLDTVLVVDHHLHAALQVVLHRISTAKQH